MREQKRLQEQPLGNEAVQRRQTGHRQRADERKPCDPGHAVDQPAQAPQVTLAGGVQNGARAQKEQALDERVIEAVIERRDQRECGEGVHAHTPKHDAEPNGCKDDAEVLDR